MLIAERLIGPHPGFFWYSPEFGIPSPKTVFNPGRSLHEALPRHQSAATAVAVGSLVHAMVLWRPVL